MPRTVSRSASKPSPQKGGKAELPVLIVEGRFYEDIADDLAEGATAALRAAGVSYERISVPGSFEVPAAIRWIARSRKGKRYSGYLALGCVIRGQTEHYDHICREVSRAIMDLTTEDGLAIGFGILTCPNYALAQERAAPNKKNKGAEAVKACLAMMTLKKGLR
ncbi:MAG: 6,7-dimethyl-8-ribityllumazine synthase [Alphaproteobacteria bacterium]|nr:6,7-dimethyl-8-ribityllumazine synthase [Alphaproteobacteria bacterium]